MATDNYKHVLYNDGEGITHTDANNAQRFLIAAIQEQILATMIPNIGLTVSAGSHDPEFYSQANAASLGPDWVTIATSRAFCLQPGSAFLRKGSAANKVQIAQGTLMQLISSTLTGDDAKLLSYTFAGTEEVTIAAGPGGGLRRIDLIQMKLEYVEGTAVSRDFEDATTRIVTSTSMNTTRRVQCTLSIKSSANAATPTIPDPDSGYCVIGTVAVEENYATGTDLFFGFDWDGGGTNGFVYDQRWPLRVKAYRIEPSQWYAKTAWTITQGVKAVATNATNELIVPLPAHMGRVVAVAVEQGDALNFGTGHALCRLNATGYGPIDSTAPVGLNTIAFPNGGGVPQVEAITFEAASLGTNAPAVSSVAKIGMPMWTNGLRSHYEEKKSNGNANRRGRRCYMRVINAPNTAILLGVVVYIAEGI